MYFGVWMSSIYTISIPMNFFNWNLLDFERFSLHPLFEIKIFSLHEELTRSQEWKRTNSEHIHLLTRRRHEKTNHFHHLDTLLFPRLLRIPFELYHMIILDIFSLGCNIFLLLCSFFNKNLKVVLSHSICMYEFDFGINTTGTRPSPITNIKHTLPYTYGWSVDLIQRWLQFGENCWCSPTPAPAIAITKNNRIILENDRRMNETKKSEWINQTLRK